MEPPAELFTAEELPQVCLDALRSLKMPDRVALVLICDRLAKIFRPSNEAAGSAAVVDAARLFGGKFSNTVRSTIAAAAGIHPGVRLPAHLSPQRDSVKAAQRSIARRLLPLLDHAREVLRSIAESEV